MAEEARPSVSTASAGHFSARRVRPISRELQKHNRKKLEKEGGVCCERALLSVRYGDV